MSKEKQKWKPKCNRCGQCCQDVWLSWSPKKLKTAYKNFRFNDRKGPWPADVYLIYPMLIFKKKDEYPGTGHTRYRYRCLHYSKKNGCRIHNIKPEMCTRFPYYHEVKIKNLASNHFMRGSSQYKGCGYNQRKKEK